MRFAASMAFILATMPAGAYTATAPAPGNADTNRVDRYHRYLSGRVLRVAESINNLVTNTFRKDEEHGSEMTDRFFGNLLTAYQVEGSYIRVTPRLILSEGGHNEYKLDFSARLRLHDISDRLKLYADSYDTDYDTMEDIFSARYRRVIEQERSEGATAGLTYFFTDDVKRKVSLSTGMKFRPEPSPKIRLRGNIRKWFEIWSAEFRQSGFWSEKDGFGERTEFALDRPTGEIHRIRLRSAVVWSELSHGVDWGQYASYDVRFSPRRRAAIQLGMRGYSHPSWVTDQYLARVNYRQRIHRDWLFLEIEPGLDFFREDHFKAAPFINISLEIAIGAFDRL
ncbi:MAG: hypothetical protein ACNA7J_12535 [Wenzhouxiangella sp.]